MVTTESDFHSTLQASDPAEKRTSHIAFQPSLLGFLTMLKTDCELHDSTAQSPSNNVSLETLSF